MCTALSTLMRSSNFKSPYPFLKPPILVTTLSHHHHHLFSTTSPTPRKGNPQLPPRPTLPDTDLKHVYLKGSGPGGQKINKTSSAVQLTHLPTGIVVKSQATRSQSQNHSIAKRILAEKIEFLEKGQESRAAKKVEWLVRKKGSADKKKRRKYRALAEAKEKDGSQEVSEVEEEGVEVGEAVVGEDMDVVKKSEDGTDLVRSRGGRA